MTRFLELPAMIRDDELFDWDDGLEEPNTFKCAYGIQCDCGRKIAIRTGKTFLFYRDEKPGIECHTHT